MALGMAMLVALLSFDNISSADYAPASVDAVSNQVCCKTCHKGKACGNSCIARNKQCHQPPGCACDG